MTISIFSLFGRDRPPGIFRSRKVRRLFGLAPYVPLSEASQPAAITVESSAPSLPPPTPTPEPPPAPVPARQHRARAEPLDLIVSPNEIGFAHGTGVLLSRLLEDRGEIIAMRSQTSYDGIQQIRAFETHCLPPGMAGRGEIFAQVGEWLDGRTIRSILCVPYFETDLTLAVAAQAITGAPLGIWVMDDNCLVNTGIDRGIMKEALERAVARFAISPALKRRYQSEFHVPFAVVPPLVAPSLIRTDPAPAPLSRRLCMIGNIWSPHILDRISRTIAEAGLPVTWFSSNAEMWSKEISAETLRKRGVKVTATHDTAQIREEVLRSTAVLIASDPGDTGSHETALGTMSLPTRLPFVMATTGTPVIVLGRPDTAAADFVDHFGIGRTIPYDGNALRGAIGALDDPTEQNRIRATSAELARRFSFEGASDFIFRTIEADGRWPDDRFESLLPQRDDAFGFFIDKPVPKQYRPLFSDIISLCDRLAAAGIEPDWILDIGASTGIWSRAVAEVFDQARFVLCDPMFSRYPQLWMLPDFELVETAVGAERGEARFDISGDLYGSSLIAVSGAARTEDRVTVPVRTVDDIVAEKRLTGRGLLKADVQFAEHLVIAGASTALALQVDIVILELTLPRVHPQAHTLLEMTETMQTLGFRLFDQVGNWRLPGGGEMEQLDLVFVREGLKGTLRSSLPEQV